MDTNSYFSNNILSQNQSDPWDWRSSNLIPFSSSQNVETDTVAPIVVETEAEDMGLHVEILDEPNTSDENGTTMPKTHTNVKELLPLSSISDVVKNMLPQVLPTVNVEPNILPLSSILDVVKNMLPQVLPTVNAEPNILPLSFIPDNIKKIIELPSVVNEQYVLPLSFIPDIAKKISELDLLKQTLPLIPSLPSLYTPDIQTNQIPFIPDIQPQVFPQQVIPTIVPDIQPQVFPQQQVVPTIVPDIQPQVFPQQVIPTIQQVVPTIVPDIQPQVFPQQVIPTIQQVVPTIVPDIQPQVFPQQVIPTIQQVVPTIVPDIQPQVLPQQWPTITPDISNQQPELTFPQLIQQVLPTNIPDIQPQVLPQQVPTIVPDIQPQVLPQQALPTITPDISNQQPELTFPQLIQQVLPTNIPDIQPQVLPQQALPTITPDISIQQPELAFPQLIQQVLPTNQDLLPLSQPVLTPLQKEPAPFVPTQDLSSIPTEIQSLIPTIKTTQDVSDSSTVPSFLSSTVVSTQSLPFVPFTSTSETAQPLLSTDVQVSETPLPFNVDTTAVTPYTTPQSQMIIIPSLTIINVSLNSISSISPISFSAMPIITTASVSFSMTSASVDTIIPSLTTIPSDILALLSHSNTSLMDLSQAIVLESQSIQTVNNALQTSTDLLTNLSLNVQMNNNSFTTLASTLNTVKSTVINLSYTTDTLTKDLSNLSISFWNYKPPATNIPNTISPTSIIATPSVDLSMINNSLVSLSTSVDALNVSNTMFQAGLLLSSQIMQNMNNTIVNLSTNVSQLTQTQINMSRSYWTTNNDLDAFSRLTQTNVGLLNTSYTDLKQQTDNSNELLRNLSTAFWNISTLAIVNSLNNTNSLINIIQTSLALSSADYTSTTQNQTVTATATSVLVSSINNLTNSVSDINGSILNISTIANALQQSNILLSSQQQKLTSGLVDTTTAFSGFINDINGSLLNVCNTTKTLQQATSVLNNTVNSVNIAVSDLVQTHNNLNTSFSNLSQSFWNVSVVGLVTSLNTTNTVVNALTENTTIANTSINTTNSVVNSYISFINDINTSVVNLCTVTRSLQQTTSAFNETLDTLTRNATDTTSSVTNLSQSFWNVSTLSLLNALNATNSVVNGLTNNMGIVKASVDALSLTRQTDTVPQTVIDINSSLNNLSLSYWSTTPTLVSSLNTTTTALNTQIANLTNVQKNIESLSASISPLSGSLTSIDDRLTKISSDYTSTTTNLNSQSTFLTNVQKNIESLSASITPLSGSLTTINDRLTKISSDYTTTTTNLNTQTTILNTQIANLTDTQKNVDSLTASITPLSGSLTTINDRLTKISSDYTTLTNTPVVSTTTVNSIQQTVMNFSTSIMSRSASFSGSLIVQNNVSLSGSLTVQTGIYMLNATGNNVIRFGAATLNNATKQGARIVLYDNSPTVNNGVDFYGFGIGSTQMNYFVPDTIKHSFMVNGVESLGIDDHGITLATDRYITAPSSYTIGPSSTQVGYINYAPKSTTTIYNNGTAITAASSVFVPSVIITNQTVSIRNVHQITLTAGTWIVEGVGCFTPTGVLLNNSTYLNCIEMWIQPLAGATNTTSTLLNTSLMTYTRDIPVFDSTRTHYQIKGTKMITCTAQTTLAMLISATGPTTTSIPATVGIQPVISTTSTSKLTYFQAIRIA
uniref:Uncharacterized protein n=1 Tax=viral metagenome TaxID=1070528 RepID=A0A6C0CRK6_9ZZZZ